MGIKHTVPAGLPTGLLTGKVAGDDWRADHVSLPFPLPLLTSVNTALTPAAASAAANVELFVTSKATRNVIDLSSATQARLVSQCIATGNVVGASYKLSYMTTNAATWAGTDAGPICVMGTTGGVAGIMHDSGWVNLPAGAKIDSCYIAVLVGTALGTTPPTIGSLTAYFR